MSDIPVISTIGVEAADRAFATLTAAFIADPVIGWIYPRAEDYLDAYPRFLQAFCGSGIEDGTAFGDEALSGVCIWLAPGSRVDEHTVVAVVKETIAPERLETFGAITEQIDQYHPQDEPLWYLPCIGVDVTGQGKGVGSALMKHALRLCDEQGVRAYLESSNPSNVSLYERHGFEVMGRIEAGSAPPITPMIRDRR